MKKLLVALLAVGALSLVPSAEAGRCGRKRCAPRRCEEKEVCKPAQCTSDKQIIDYKYFPCCRTVVEQGYKKCPVERTTTTCIKDNTRCCKERMSCCLFPGDPAFKQEELDRANGGRSAEASMESADAYAE